MEVLSVILTPIVLCFSLPACAANVIEFVREHSTYVEGIGTVCDYALFDFDKYGDEDFGAPMNGYMDKSQRPKGGKMEQSFLNFQKNYPQWGGGAGVSGAAGREFLNRINTYKNIRYSSVSYIV